MQAVIDQTGVGIGFLISSALLTGISGEIFSSSFQIPEPTQPTADASLWGWYRPDIGVLTRATDGGDDWEGSYDFRITASTSASWMDQSGNDYHLHAYSRNTTPYVIANDVNAKPTVVFRGGPTPPEETSIASTDQGLGQPYSLYILFNAFTWNHYYCILDGVTFNSPTYEFHALVMQHSASTPATNEMCILANEFANDFEFATTPQTDSGSALNTWHILTCVFSGSNSSSIQIDNGTVFSGSVLNVTPGGIHLGGLYHTLTRQYNGKIGGLIVSNAIDTGSQAIHKNWLNWYGGSGIL
jgi:hypothetical protein